MSQIRYEVIARISPRECASILGLAFHDGCVFSLLFRNGSEFIDSINLDTWGSGDRDIILPSHRKNLLERADGRTDIFRRTETNRTRGRTIVDQLGSSDPPYV